MSDLNQDFRAPVLSYAPVVLKLLQGTLYSEEGKLWTLLQENLGAVQQYFWQIGLDLHLHEAEGLAYLVQPDEEELEGELPRLIKRAPLGFEATLLAVLLREALEEFDLGNADARDLFLTAKDIKTRLLPYLGASYDEARVFKQLERYILQLVRLGFLREIPSENNADFDRRVFQVMRILKAKLTNEKLTEIRDRLREYVQSVKV